MPLFDQEGFVEFVLDQGIVGLFEEPVTIKSGRKSNFYVNWRSVASDVFAIDVLSDFVVDFVASLLHEKKLPVAPDCFMGVPEGATKLGIITQYKFATRSPEYGPGSHSLPMGRSKAKAHGLPEDRFFVGAPRGKTILLEDTTTTGGSLLETLDSLIESEMDVIACIGLTNRMERRDDGLSVAEAIAQRRTRDNQPVPYFFLSSALELLPRVIQQKTPPAGVVSAVVEEFQQYGLEPLRVL